MLFQILKACLILITEVMEDMVPLAVLFQKKRISKNDKIVKVITLDDLIKKLKIKSNFHIKII